MFIFHACTFICLFTENHSGGQPGYEQLQGKSSGITDAVPMVTFNVSLMELIRTQVQQQLQQQQQQQPGMEHALQMELPESVYDYVQPLNERNHEYLSLVNVPAHVAGMRSQVEKFQKNYGVRVKK